LNNKEVQLLTAANKNTWATDVCDNLGLQLQPCFKYKCAANLKKSIARLKSLDLSVFKTDCPELSLNEYINNEDYHNHSLKWVGIEGDIANHTDGKDYLS
jgi:hypothetical protein